MMSPHPVADREQGRSGSGLGVAAALEDLVRCFVSTGVSDVDGAIWVGLTLAPSGWLTSMGRMAHGHLWLGKAKPFQEAGADHRRSLMTNGQ